MQYLTAPCSACSVSATIIYPYHPFLVPFMTLFPTCLSPFSPQILKHTHVNKQDTDIASSTTTVLPSPPSTLFYFTRRHVMVSRGPVHHEIITLRIKQNLADNGDTVINTLMYSVGGRKRCQNSNHWPVIRTQCPDSRQLHRQSGHTDLVVQTR